MPFSRPLPYSTIKGTKQDIVANENGKSMPPPLPLASTSRKERKIDNEITNPRLNSRGQCILSEKDYSTALGKILETELFPTMKDLKTEEDLFDRLEGADDKTKRKIFREIEKYRRRKQVLNSNKSHIKNHGEDTLSLKEFFENFVSESHDNLETLSIDMKKNHERRYSWRSQERHKTQQEKETKSSKVPNDRVHSKTMESRRKVFTLINPSTEEKAKSFNSNYLNSDTGAISEEEDSDFYESDDDGPIERILTQSTSLSSVPSEFYFGDEFEQGHDLQIGDKAPRYIGKGDLAEIPINISTTSGYPTRVSQVSNERVKDSFIDIQDQSRSLAKKKSTNNKSRKSKRITDPKSVSRSLKYSLNPTAKSLLSKLKSSEEKIDSRSIFYKKRPKGMLDNNISSDK